MAGERDFRTDTLRAFIRHGFNGVVVSSPAQAHEEEEEEDDADFYLLIEGVRYFAANCNEEIELLPPPTLPLKLGDKVRLGEWVCAVLQRLGCGDYNLSPHQIALCDWKCLLPAIQHLGALSQEHVLQAELLRELADAGAAAADKPEEEEDDEEVVPIVTDAELSELQALVLAQQHDLEEKTRRLKQLDEEIKREGETTDDDDDALLEMKSLMQQVDAVRAEEKEFKRACREERERLLQEPDHSATATDDDDDAMEELESTKARLQDMANRQRVKLAGVSRIEANAQRALDDAVTTLERRQYEQRFLELYEEISSMSDQHRKQVLIFNSLTNKLRITRGQIDLLTSIRVGFLKSTGNAQAESTFALQFPRTLADYDLSLAKTQDRLAELEQARQQADRELAEMYAKKTSHYRHLAEDSGT